MLFYGDTAPLTGCQTQGIPLVNVCIAIGFAEMPRPTQGDNALGLLCEKALAS